MYEHPSKGRGRPVSRESKLGRLLSAKGLKSYEVGGLASISSRMMTEYCARRKQYSQRHLLALCRVLNVTPDQILEDEDLEQYDYTATTPDSTDREAELSSSETSVGGLHQTKTIQDLQREQAQKFGPRYSRLREAQ